MIACGFLVMTRCVVGRGLTRNEKRSGGHRGGGDVCSSRLSAIFRDSAPEPNDPPRPAPHPVSHTFVPRLFLLLTQLASKKVSTQLQLKCRLLSSFFVLSKSQSVPRKAWTNLRKPFCRWHDLLHLCKPPVS